MIYLDKLPRGNHLVSVLLPAGVTSLLFFIAFAIPVYEIGILMLLIGPLVIGFLSVVCFGVMKKFSLASLAAKNFMSFLIFVTAMTITGLLFPIERDSAAYFIFIMLIAIWPVLVFLAYAFVFMAIGSFFGVVFSGLIKR